ncbi:MAG: dihydroorotate dehydrogenase electron transfer subunit [Thermoleophilaceae bacterium]
MSVPAGDRTLAPPERREAVVAEVTRVGAYELIAAHDRSGPADPRPGQFYMLATGERWGGGDRERPYLPRAFSFARARRLDGGGVQLAFLLEDVGPGTHRLGELAPGEPLNLLGPLGAGFTAPAEGRRAVLAGGGIGTAPLLALHDALRARGEQPPVVLGFRSAAFAEAAGLFSGAPEVVTDDGSRGRAGLVTEPLREELARDPDATVHACGPPAMLAAVRALCAELDVPAQLALEAGMACGYGACFGCVVETKEGYARVCVDGPVFDAAVLA